MSEHNEIDLETRIDAATAVLIDISRTHNPATLASSLSLEDMVLFDMIVANNLPIETFTLDTGRLHGETHTLMQQVSERYNRKITVLTPDHRALESFISKFGPNAFYDSVELRHRCCDIRKVQPLNRALEGKKAWITGQRRGQSTTRAALEIAEWDTVRGLHKFNPLAFWSGAEVRTYIERHEVPFNPLHDKGYASIGCVPCTRPITIGEDERAGRWWWESASKECGLHQIPPRTNNSQNQSRTINR